MIKDDDLRNEIVSYVTAHLPEEAVIYDRFAFIRDAELSKRVAEEFMSARYVYKLLEALRPTGWLLKAQIRVQVLLYASVYEAILHHVLFDLLPDRPEVRGLKEFGKLIRISIPAQSHEKLTDHLTHEGHTIIPTYQGIGRTDETKVRFDSKAECAASIGIIEDDLKAELIEIYEARNAIHIHAEIRKDLNYELDLSKKAYWRMQPFCDQVTSYVTIHGL